MHGRALHLGMEVGGLLITDPLLTEVYRADSITSSFLLSSQANTKQGVGRRGGITTRAPKKALCFGHKLDKH